MQSREPILEPEQSLEVTMLSGSRETVKGSVLDMDGPCLRVRLGAEVAFAAPVKVECGPLILLGDVCHCELATEGFNVTITARHKLELLPDLLRLNETLRGVPETAMELKRTPIL